MDLDLQKELDTAVQMANEMRTIFEKIWSAWREGDVDETLDIVESDVGELLRRFEPPEE